jgi:hypothetical protein
MLTLGFFKVGAELISRKWLSGKLGYWGALFAAKCA